MIVIGMEVTLYLQRDQSPAGTLIESAANTGSRPIIAISDQVGYQYQTKYMISDQSQYRNFCLKSIGIYFGHFLWIFTEITKAPQPPFTEQARRFRAVVKTALRSKSPLSLFHPSTELVLFKRSLLTETDRDRNNGFFLYYSTLDVSTELSMQYLYIYI